MKKVIYLLACVAFLGCYSCSDDDDGLKMQDISVEFAVSDAGMDGTGIDLGIKLSRATKESLDVTVQMISTEVSESDITVTPALTNGQVVVNIPAGQASGSFTVAKADGKSPEGNVKFRILSLSLSEGYKIGTLQEMNLSFSPIVSTGGKLTLEGNDGAEKYANMVYVDLSNNSQIQIKRKSWNLGFYCGDEFRVILNSSYATVAVASEKTDFAAVTLEDAQKAPNIAAGAMSEDFSADWVDDVEGDLTKTAFGMIAENAAENKVFFVASADNKTNTDGTENRSLWYKVKVTRNGEGYRVEYGKVGDTTPKTVEIAKNPIYNFVGLSLESGEKVDAQAEGKKWDIMWAYAAAVSQSETAYAQVLASLPAIRQSIRETENALCMLLRQAPQTIKRSTLEEQQLPSEFSVGIPLQLLSNRPDVKAAEMALANTYYNTNSARAAFYPQITISGSAGWTNSAGSMIVNPGKLLASALGSLTQPLFYRGSNIARLKIAKAQQEEAKLAFQQSLLNAGSEVSNALSLYQTTAEKTSARKFQVESAEKGAEYTKELFKLGTSTYLEVLSAEQSLLSARLSQVSDSFDSMQAVVSLYRALGGGRED